MSVTGENTNKKVSIVMAYYNRKSLLLKTLESIAYFSSYSNFEVIIVDDGSREDERIEDFISKFNYLIKVHRIDPNQKTHINPCIPYNKGFELATGDVIIIQNPECIHDGDIISHSVNITETDYYCYHCYSLNKEDTESILKNSLAYQNMSFINLQEKAITYDGDSGWYAHKQYRPGAMHFCTAITKNNLHKLGGFDERFAQGYAYDDREFFDRICRLKLSIIFVEHPKVFHLNHYNESSKNHASSPNNASIYSLTRTEHKINWRD